MWMCSSLHSNYTSYWWPYCVSSSEPLSFSDNEDESARTQCSASSTTTNPEAASAQLARYLSNAAESGSGSGCSFWSSRRVTYSKILPLAEDLLAAAASQAYVECVFSLCGLLTAGRRNHMSWSLEMRSFLKLNAQICWHLLTVTVMDNAVCIMFYTIEKQVHHCAMCQANLC